jgi:hypothetical protein
MNENEERLVAAAQAGKIEREISRLQNNSDFINFYF